MDFYYCPSTFSGFDFEVPADLILQRFQNYRLNKKFVDVTIKVGNESFPAHRMVLEDSSPVIKAQLSYSWNKNGVCELSPEFVAPEIVEDLLSFFYLGKIIVTPENAHALCIASHYLDIPNLLEVTDEYLSEKISDSNVLELYNFSGKTELESLRKNCVKYIVKTIDVFLENEKILSFSPKEVETLINELNDHENNFSIKISLFKLVITWTKSDSMKRSPLLPSMLKLIPLNSLSLRYLSEVVATEKLVSDSLLCSKILIEAFSKVSIASSSDSSVFLAAQKTDILCCIFENSHVSVEKFFFKRLKPPYTRYESAIENLPYEEFHMGIAAIKNHVYLCGGQKVFEKHTSNQSPKCVSEGIHPSMKDLFEMYSTEYSRSSELKIYDLISRKSKKLRSMPTPRYHCGAAILNNFLYISGGYDANEKELRTVLKYNITTDRWQCAKSMKQIRGKNKLVYVAGKLYALGGSPLTVETYDPDRSKTADWKKVTNPGITNKYEFDAVTLGEKLFVHSSETINTQFKVYSPACETWETLTPLKDYCVDSLVAMNGKLWALIYSDYIDYKNCSHETVYVPHEFDPRTGMWSELPDVNVQFWKNAIFNFSYQE